MAKTLFRFSLVDEIKTVHAAVRADNIGEARKIVEESYPDSDSGQENVGGVEFSLEDVPAEEEIWTLQDESTKGKENYYARSKTSAELIPDGDYLHTVCAKCRTQCLLEYRGLDPSVPLLKITCPNCGELWNGKIEGARGGWHEWTKHRRD